MRRRLALLVGLSLPFVWAVACTLNPQPLPPELGAETASDGGPSSYGDAASSPPSESSDAGTRGDGGLTGPDDPLDGGDGGDGGDEADGGDGGLTDDDAG